VGEEHEKKQHDAFGHMKQTLRNKNGKGGKFKAITLTKPCLQKLFYALQISRSHLQQQQQNKTKKKSSISPSRN